MSLMDLFKSKGSAKPSSGSKEGDWKDWFLDMKGRRPFGKSASPTAGSEKGDLMDWYLNRTGPFGKFNREEEEYDYLDYNPYMLFNGGGSVRRTSRGQGVTSSRDNTDPSSGFFGPLKGERRKFQRLGQTHVAPYAGMSLSPHELMPEFNREQAIMNQYTRPSGGTYTGGYEFDPRPNLKGYFQEPAFHRFPQSGPAGAPVEGPWNREYDTPMMGGIGETALNIGDTFPLEGFGSRPGEGYGSGSDRDYGPQYEELKTIPLDEQFDMYGYPIGQDDWGYIGAARGGLMSLRR